METQIFWDVIANYNVATWMIQILNLFCIVIGLSIAYKKNNARVMKVVLGIINLYIAIIFFGVYGTEPIQKFFAMPLYIGIGVLFLKDAYCETDTVNKPNMLQVCIYILYILYPWISLLLGNYFPRMVTYVMPCPIVCLSLVFYSTCKKKSKLLLLLLTIWGLTGIKSLLFDAYEDIILLICGIYGSWILYKECKNKY